MNRTGISWAVISTREGFRSLEDEWEDLYRSCPTATPFQSHPWLFSWWENYAEDDEYLQLELVCVRNEDGLLVGALPFMVQSKLGIKRLLLVGTGISDHLDILVRDGWGAEVVAAAKGFLQGGGSWSVADFQQLGDRAMVWEIFKAWERPALRFEQDVSPFIEVDDWAQMTVRLGKNRRHTARRTVRRMQEDGAVFEMAGLDRISEASRRFVGLHREMWKNRDITPEHLSERFAAQISSSARRMTKDGSGGISELWSGGEVVASQFVTIGRDSVGGFLSGASAKTVERYQVSSLFIWDCANIARQRSLAYYDFLRGDEDYKLKWRPDMAPHDRAILSRRLVPLLAFLAYRTLSVRRMNKK